MTVPVLSLPTSANIASVVFSITRVTGITPSPFTLSEKAYKWPGVVWAADVALPPITNRAVAADWMAFGTKLEGRYGIALIGDPAASTPRGIATGTPLVDGANQTGKTLNTKGWTPSQTGIMLPGDYIQLGSSSSARLYMVTAAANSDASGKAALTLSHELRTSPSDSAAIVVQNPVGAFRLKSDEFSWSVEPGPLYRFSFSFIEVVNA